MVYFHCSFLKMINLRWLNNFSISARIHFSDFCFQLLGEDLFSCLEIFKGFYGNLLSCMDYFHFPFLRMITFRGLNNYSIFWYFCTNRFQWLLASNFLGVDLYSCLDIFIGFYSNLLSRMDYFNISFLKTITFRGLNNFSIFARIDFSDCLLLIF